jgi:hypothetical protein
MRSRDLQILVLGLWLTIGSPLQAQMTPDAPLKDFRFPIFADNGYKLWELRGVEGRYLSETESVIFGLDLKVFSGDEAMLLESRLRSPSAHVYMDEARAESDSSIFLSGPNFVLQGEDWTWLGKEKKLVVRQDARVIFNGEINLLK